MRSQDHRPPYSVPRSARRRIAVAVALVLVPALALIAWRGEAILLDLSTLAALCF